jgi:hypothetical protein
MKLDFANDDGLMHEDGVTLKIEAPALFTNFRRRRHVKTHWLVMKIRFAIILKKLVG